MEFRATTIVAVRHQGQVAIAGDGQVTFGENTIMKNTTTKVRTLADGRILAGFAGSSADAFTLYEKFEASLKDHSNNLVRAVVELAKDWRSDRHLRKLDALLLVADRTQTLVISGSGDIIEPDDGVTAIGSGGSFAMAAARALVNHSSLSATQIAKEALKIAASICVYTNDHITVLELN